MADRPSPTGRIAVVEGYLFYLDRKFKIRKGTIDFVDPDLSQAILDVEAEILINDRRGGSKDPYTILLTMKGPIKESTLELNSEPVLGRTDILSLLVFGTIRSRLTGQDTPGNPASIGTVLQERIAALSSKRLVDYAGRKIGTLLALDEVSIDGNLFTFGKSWGPQLLAAKKITDRMEITYSLTAGHVNEQNIRLNYNLSKYFSIVGQTDQKGKSGLDLKYRIQFK